MEMLSNLLSPAFELLAMFLLHSLWIGSLAYGGAWLSMTTLRNSSARIRCNLLLMWLGAIPVLSIAVAARQSQSLHEKPLAVVARQNLDFATTNNARRFDIARSDSDDGPSSQSPPRELESLTQSTRRESNPKPGSAQNMSAKVSMHPQLNRQLNRPPQQPALAGRSWEWTRSRISFIIVIAWMVGVTTLCLRMLFDWVQLRRWVTHSVAADPSLLALITSLRIKLQIKQPVDVRLVQNIAVPMAVGILRPMILLPASCITHLSPAELEAILVHELAHIRRFDFAFHLFQRTVEILLFFHPGVWWMGSQLRQEREFDCDDVVVRFSPNRLSYARALASIAEIAAGRNSLAMSASSGALKTRIQRILGKPPRATYLRPSVFGLGGSLSILGVLLWVLIPRAVAPTQAEESQHKTSTSVVAKTSPSKAPISGFILGPDARMLAGATVVLRQTPLYEKGQADLATTTTDATGQFAFEQNVLDKLKESSGNRRPFLLDVIARKPGYAIRWIRLNAARKDLDLQLVPSTKLTGRFLDDRGEPLAGAMVRVIGIMSLNTLTNTDDFRSMHRGGDSFIDLADTKPLAAICDINGRFELDELPRRVGLKLVVEDKRVSREVIYAATTDEPLDSRARTTDRLTNQRTPIEIMRTGATRKLDRAVHLRLVFVDDTTGNPIENVVVNSWPAHSDVVQRSGTDGAVDFYQIDQRAIVGWTARVTPPANSAWLGEIVSNQQKPTGDLFIQHEVRLTSGITLKGRVIDEASGKGLANAVISYHRKPICNVTQSNVFLMTVAASVTSDEDGQFHVVVPESRNDAGELRLLRSPPGYETAPGNFAGVPEKAIVYYNPAAASPVEITEALDIARYRIDLSSRQEAERPQFRLKRLPAVLFRFVDSQGEPMAVNIAARSFSNSLLTSQVEVKPRSSTIERFSNPEKQFPTQQEREELALWLAEAKPSALAQMTERFSNPEVGPWEELARWLALRQSKPLGTASTQAPVVESSQDTLHQVASGDAFDASVLLYGASHEPGEFQMLIVSEDQTYGAFYAANSLHASASETTITLQPLGSISGVVTDRATGLPANGASVSLIVQFHPKQGQTLEHNITDERGQYRFEHLIPGMQYTLSINAKQQDPAKPPQQITVPVRLRPDTHLQLETPLD